MSEIYVSQDARDQMVNEAVMINPGMLGNTTTTQKGHHRVYIDKATNGFVLQIGCCTFVAKTWGEASAGLDDYWKDPVAAEKKYRQQS